MSRLLVLLVLVACSSDSKHETAKRPPPVVADAAVATDETPGLRLPAGVTPLAYDVRLELDPDRDTFAGRVAIRARLDAPASKIWLHADELEVHSVTVAGIAATFGPQTPHEMHAIRLPAPASGEVTIELAYTGHVRRELEGMFRQKFAGKWFLYSQAESTFARRILPCFDEPKFKVPWNVTLVVPDGQVAAANAPIASEHVMGKQREVTFATMPALPSHLFAVAVGPFSIVDLGTAGKQRVPVRALVAPKDTRRVGAAAVWVPKLVDALEQYFDQPLPLAKLDLVAVPRFFGAMENPGLITFEVTTLAGNDKDPGFMRRHIRFLAHELAHQWVGNAVTPAWWDDLWLAEAFATWLDDKMSNALGTLDDPALRTQLARAKALDADREIAAKPLRRKIETTDDIEDAFDAISYEKGAAVLAMFEDFVGETKFRDVVRAYMKSSGTASAQDFLAQLGRVDAGLAKAFGGYLDRAGAPVVDVAVTCAAKNQVIVTPRDGAAVPVCIRHPAGKTCVLASGATPIDVASCPAWLVGNANGRGYYHVQSKQPAAVAQLAPAERLAHGADRAAAIERGELPARDALAEIDALLARGDPYAELAAISMSVELDRTIAERDVATWGGELAKRFGKRLTRAAVWKPKSAIELAMREALVELVPPARFAKDAQREARDLVEIALKHGLLSIRNEELIVAVALAAPGGGKLLFERIVESAAKLPAFADEWFEGLSYFDASFAPRAVELVLDKRFEPDRTWPVVGGMLVHTATRDAAWRAVKPKVGELLATLGAQEAAMMIESTGGLCDAQKRDEVETSFRPHVSTIVDGERALARALAAIDRCIRASGAPTAPAGP